MEAIFDPQGQTVAWRSREIIFDLDGSPRAYLRGGVLYSFSGGFIGRYEDGFFRDAEGNAVACHSDASGGPPPPLGRRNAVPPVPVYPRAPQKLEAAPPPPRMRSRRWSALSWGEFVAVAEPLAR